MDIFYLTLQRKCSPRNTKRNAHGWLHSNDDIQGRDSSKDGIVVRLLALQEAMQDLWIDLSDFGQADPIGLGGFARISAPFGCK